MLRIYDEFLEDETILALKPLAYKLHVSALIYCSRNLTDGEVTDRAVKVLQAILDYPVKRWVGELVTAGVWTPITGGYVIRNYLEFNPTAATVKEEKRAARERMRKLREKRSATKGSGERDGEQNAERAVPPPPIPSHPFEVPPEDQALPVADEGGHEAKLLKRLLVATGARADTDIRKIVRTVKANGSTEREIACAIEASTGPGVRDPLAVGLAELKKLAAERKEPAA